MIKAILFDKDGTLLDFNATWLSFTRELAEAATDGDTAAADALLLDGGLDPQTNTFRPNSVVAAGTNADVVRHFYKGVEGEPLRALVDSANRKSSDIAGRAIPLPGAIEAVRALHKSGMVLGIATNDSTSGAEKTMAAFGISSMFAAAYGYDAVANPKPAPDALLAFAELAGVRPSEVAMVGDNLHDLEMAKAGGAGLAIGVLSGTGTREALAPLADVILDSVAALPGYFGVPLA
ncbi:MAG: HAD family hydrolase [Rhizobiaceae bacterium]